LNLKELKEVSKNRIKNILRKHRVGNIRQLESKICEAGPPQMRPDPDLLTKALKTLVNMGIIKSIKESGISGGENIFYLADDFNVNSPSDKERYAKIIKLYGKYLDIVKRKGNCGDILEIIIQKAIKASNTYHFVGGPGVSTNKFQVNGTLIKGDFDFILQSQTGLLGVELKNKRKWLYPDHKDFWVAIYRCLQNNALPVIIARKFPYIARLIFKNIGVLGYETHNQYLKPDLVDLMAEMRDKDGLGFADLRFIDEPEERHINFFRNILPNQEKDSWETFISKKDVLKKHAEVLKEDVLGGRTRLFYAFLVDIGLATAHEERKRYLEEDYSDLYNDYPTDF